MEYKKTKRIEFWINFIAVLLILLGISFFIGLLIFNKNVGGSVLNSKSVKTDDIIFLADKQGNLTEVSEAVWKKNLIFTEVTFIFVILGTISIAYLYVRYLFIPSVKINIGKIFRLFKK